jgi:transposase
MPAGAASCAVTDDGSKLGCSTRCAKPWRTPTVKSNGASRASLWSMRTQNLSHANPPFRAIVNGFRKLKGWELAFPDAKRPLHRNRVERFFNRINHCRRIATRYEKASMVNMMRKRDTPSIQIRPRPSSSKFLPHNDRVCPQPPFDPAAAIPTRLF